jgi:hypothetical protein
MSIKLLNLGYVLIDRKLFVDIVVKCDENEYLYHMFPLVLGVSVEIVYENKWYLRYWEFPLTFFTKINGIYTCTMFVGENM